MVRIVAMNKDRTLRVVDHGNGNVTLQQLTGGKWTVKRHLGLDLSGYPAIVNRRWRTILKEYDLVLKTDEQKGAMI